MKYLLPFWWINRGISEILSSKVAETFVMLTIMSVFFSFTFYVVWFVLWEDIEPVFARIFILINTPLIIINYIISYLYYKKNKELRIKREKEKFKIDKEKYVNHSRME